MHGARQSAKRSTATSAGSPSWGVHDHAGVLPGTLLTAEFVRPHLRRRAARLLEVGAGDGDLAAHLDGKGVQVVALDHDHRMIERAKSRGRTVLWADWPHFKADGFDVVLFSRSLHHMDDLGAAVVRALQLLRRRGVVLVEEFAAEAVDSICMAWLAGVVTGLAAAGRTPRRRGFLARLLGDRDPLEAWSREHAGVHAATAIAASLLAHSRVRCAGQAPYLFRYFDEYEPAAQRIVLAAEASRIRRGLLPAVGRRFVLDQRPDARRGRRPTRQTPGPGPTLEPEC